MVPYYSGLMQVRDGWLFHMAARINAAEYGGLTSPLPRRLLSHEQVTRSEA